MANSVIILDEVQMLPVEYLIPCAKALEELVNNYNCSVVLCSATQPEVERFMSEKIKVKEICSNIAEMYEFFNKTKVKFIGNKTADELVSRLQGLDQCLLIVNTKTKREKYMKSWKRLTGRRAYSIFPHICVQPIGSKR